MKEEGRTGGERGLGSQGEEEVLWVQPGFAAPVGKGATVPDVTLRGATWAAENR